MATEIRFVPPEEIRDALGDRGQKRLQELADDLNTDPDLLAQGLLELCQRGEISLLGMDEYVNIHRQQ